MLTDKKFYIKFQDDENVICEIAVKEDISSFKQETMNATRMVMDGKEHTFFHEDEIVFISYLSTEEVSPYPTGGYVFKESGNDKLFGVAYAYERYSTDSDDICFFFDGNNNCIGLETYRQEISVQIKILEWSDIIPAEMLEVPSDYLVRPQV
jgi:hydroxymethylpyrimidine pyrophosphatase-like HAD family hydrolase